jgi:hypothetical protein
MLLRSFRPIAAAGCIVAVASACGGATFNEGGDKPDGTGGKGGTSAGRGGSSAGGSVNGGSVNGGSGVGGAGASPNGGSAGEPNLPKRCALPPESGPCEAYIPSWHHDPETGLCKPFIYGGCGGNTNRFASLEECQRACAGGAVDYDACQAPTDCAIGAVGCCGNCDGPALTKHDFIAFAERFRDEVYRTCQLIDIACGACPPPNGEGTLKYLISDCVAGGCVVHDIRESAVTECKTSEDCSVRYGTDCCSSCSATDVVAIANNGLLADLVCGDVPQPCPACFPNDPYQHVAVCTQGRCSAVPTLK